MKISAPKVVYSPNSSLTPTHLIYISTFTPKSTSYCDRSNRFKLDLKHYLCCYPPSERTALSIVFRYGPAFRT